MKTNTEKWVSIAVVLFCLFIQIGCTSIRRENTSENRPIILRTMGSLMFGGSVTAFENGETYHADHGYAQYFIPQNARNYPLVMWHGMEQSGKTWETTPDGRDGYMQIMTRRDWPVYIIDQPGRGRAGRTQLEFMPPSAIPTSASESGAWNAFRLGIWLPPEDINFFPNVQFPQDPESISQFLRWQTPNTGNFSQNSSDSSPVMINAVTDLFRRIGSGILVTHSASGGLGWFVGINEPELIKGIVAYEPGGVVFPEGERPADIESANELAALIIRPRMIPKEDFLKLTKMPILIVYGDNILPSPHFTVEFWRLSLERAKQFVEAVNRHGGDAQLVVLPEIGIHGNTHFPFTDLNNIEVANQLADYLRSKGLDSRSNPHSGPWVK
jgi:pimeloyl-ACP methyl ester carboxylesterase